MGVAVLVLSWLFVILGGWLSFEGSVVVGRLHPWRLLTSRFCDASQVAIPDQPALVYSGLGEVVVFYSVDVVLKWFYFEVVLYGLVASTIVVKIRFWQTAIFLMWIFAVKFEVDVVSRAGKKDGFRLVWIDYDCPCFHPSFMELVYVCSLSVMFSGSLLAVSMAVSSAYMYVV